MARWMCIALSLMSHSGFGGACDRALRSLDGSWQIVFDHHNRGKERQWAKGINFPHQRARSIEVPSCWELIEKDYEGAAFYRRTFMVPAGWRDRQVRLRFDAVNFRAEVWLNDHHVGVHEGGFTPFEFCIDDALLRDRGNVLIVRVVGPVLLQDKTVDGMGPMETPQWRGAITGGIWQPVCLVATGTTYIDDVFIEPRIADNTATFHLQLMQEGKSARSREIGVVISSGEKRVAGVQKTVQLSPGLNELHLTLTIPDAVYWSPDRPHLYQAEVRAAGSDLWTSRFGMREFTIRDKQWMLNGRPFHLKAVFFEGLYPLKLAYPDSRAMAVREIRLARKAGFNMIRPWRKPPPPMWLDLADELGVLTVGGMAIECMDFPRASPRLQKWVENEVRETILRDRSRTCVVQWELFNELKRPILKEMLEPMAVLARSLDPTRLILDESGGWARGANMLLPYEATPIKFNDIHDYPGQMINDAVYTKLLSAGGMTHEAMRKLGLRGRLPGRNVVPGLMTFFSELGYGSLPDLPANNRRFDAIGNPLTPPARYHRRLARQHVQALKESGFGGIFPDLGAFCRRQQRIHGTANRRMIEAVRCNPNVNGYCIHALTAGDWIIGAGLLDLFRIPKTAAYEQTRAANQLRIISLRVRPRNVYAQRGALVEVTGVNDLAAVRGKMQLTAAGPDGEAFFSKTVRTTLNPGITSLFKEHLETGCLQGTCTLTASVVSEKGALITKNTYAFEVFSKRQLAAPQARIAIIDPRKLLAPFLKARGVDVVPFKGAAGCSRPVFVARTVAGAPKERALFKELKKYIKAGGHAVYLQAGGPRIPWGKAGNASPLLPVQAQHKRAQGHWICIPRLVKAHPVFEGLPVDTMMEGVYENVWSQSTLQGLGGETVAAAVGFDWFPDYDLRRRHYYGPGDVWWGADLAVVPFGRGRFIASQLRLVENIDRDPAADKILCNLIRFACSGMDATAR